VRGSKQKTEKVDPQNIASIPPKEKDSPDHPVRQRSILKMPSAKNLLAQKFADKKVS